MYFTVVLYESKRHFFYGHLFILYSIFDNRNINKADKYSSVYELK